MDLSELESQISLEEVKVVEFMEAEDMRAKGKVFKPGVGWVDEPGTGKKKRNIPEKSQGTKRLKTAFGKN